MAHLPSRRHDLKRDTASFTVQVDGQPVDAYDGETIAAVLLSHAVRTFFQDAPPYAPNRLYCGMGVCMQCLVTVDGTEHVRACLTLVRPGMEIATHP